VTFDARGALARGNFARGGARGDALGFRARASTPTSVYSDTLTISAQADVEALAAGAARIAA
jgi:hypothetical protein